MLDFEMFSDEGNLAVKAMVDTIIKEIRDGKIRHNELIDRIDNGIKKNS